MVVVISSLNDGASAADRAVAFFVIHAHSLTHTFCSYVSVSRLNPTKVVRRQRQREAECIPSPIEMRLFYLIRLPQKFRTCSTFCIHSTWVTSIGVQRPKPQRIQHQTRTRATSRLLSDHLAINLVKYVRYPREARRQTGEICEQGQEQCTFHAYPRRVRENRRKALSISSIFWQAGEICLG